MKEDSLRVLETWREQFGDRVDDFKKRVEQPLENDKERVEIIILKYKSPEVELKCIENIIKHTDHPYKITFFDNRNNPPNMSKIWNKLIREATCETIVMLDSDAFVQSHWLEPLLDALKIPECGIAVPVGGNSVYAFSQRKPREDKPAFVIKEHFTGCCFAMKKSVLEEMGGFDEDYLVFGQDSDMAEKFIAHPRYEIFGCPRSLVIHGVQIGEGFNASVSTGKARGDNEYDFELESKYSPNMVQYRKLSGYYKKLYESPDSGK